MFCEECGSRIPDGAVRCPACGASTGAEYSAPVREKPAPPVWEEREYLDYRESTPRTGPGGSNGASSNFRMAENEKVVRQYHCSNIRRPKCDGYLTVTNKRVMFQAKAATSRISKEVVLDSVSGLDCYYGLNVNVGGIILAVFCIIASIRCFGSGESLVVIGLLLLVLGIVLLNLQPQDTNLLFHLLVFDNNILVLDSISRVSRLDSLMYPYRLKYYSLFSTVLYHHILKPTDLRYC